jgi:hypothetical protein
MRPRRAFRSLLPIFAVSVLALAPTSAQAAVAGAFFQPENGQWMQPGTISILADAEPMSVTSGEVRFTVGGLPLAGCEDTMPVEVTIIPIDTPPGLGPSTLQCDWDATMMADGPYQVELWLDEGGGLELAADADAGAMPTPRLATVTYNIDGTAPADPSAVIDDLDPPTMADVDAGPTGTMTIGFGPSTDPGGSGIVQHEWCIGPSMLDCTGAVRSGTASAVATSATAAGAALTPGNTYYSCVRGQDLAGNFSNYACSDGFLADDVPTVPTNVIEDATSPATIDDDFVVGTGTISIAWTASTDADGIQDYDWCINDAADCSTPVRNGTTASTGLDAAGTAFADGSSYFTCVRARDNGGALSAYGCSDGFEVDASVPSAPAFVIEDATSPASVDDDLIATAGTISIAWATSGDGAGSGVADYDWCINTAADCTGALRSGTTAATDVDATGAAFTDGASYFTCVRARDNAGNTSGYTCSNGFDVDATAPSAPTTVIDDEAPPTSSDIDVLTSTGDTTIVWTASSDGTGSGLAPYEWCINTASTCTGAVRSGTTATTAVTTTGTALVSGTTYVSCVRSTDIAGNASAYACSDGFLVDTTAPTSPTGVIESQTSPATTDADVTTSTGTIAIAWTPAADGSGSGIQNYDWCINTAADCSGAIRSGTTAATGLDATGTAFTDGATYYTCVRARDNVALTSTYACSDGFIVNTTPPAPPAPTATVAPSAIEFGSQALVAGQTATQAITVTNTGASNLTVLAVSLRSSAITEFVVTNQTCLSNAGAHAPGSGGPIAPGGTCSITVAFDPTQTGVHNGGLRILSNATTSPHDVSYTGTGTNPTTIIKGTDDDDDLTGTNGDDDMDGEGGDDDMSGLDGNDDMDGGDGDDTISGGKGDDTISGGKGDDCLFGGAGDDRFFARGKLIGDDKAVRDGNDCIYGQAGNDQVTLGRHAGKLRVWGGAGSDNIGTGFGDDQVEGGAGFDRIFTGSFGDDTVVDTVTDEDQTQWTATKSRHRVLSRAFDISTFSGNDSVEIRAAYPSVPNRTIDGRIQTGQNLDTVVANITGSLKNSVARRGKTTIDLGDGVARNDKIRTEPRDTATLTLEHLDSAVVTRAETATIDATNVGTLDIRMNNKALGARLFVRASGKTRIKIRIGSRDDVVTIRGDDDTVVDRFSCGDGEDVLNIDREIWDRHSQRDRILIEKFCETINLLPAGSRSSNGASTDQVNDE